MQQRPSFPAILASALLVFLFLPGPVRAQWQPVPCPPGGKVACWADAPDGTLYAGGRAGIFKSTDSGKTWKGLPGNSTISDPPVELEWDKGNLYLVTEGIETTNSILWKSSDDGASWVQLRNDLFKPIDFRGVMDVRNDTILVSCGTTGYYSINGGQTWKNSVMYGSWDIQGLDQAWFSSFYGGLTRWTSVGGTGASVYNATVLPLHPQRLFEAAGKLFICHPQGPGFKMSADTGKTWQDGVFPIDYTSAEISIAERHDTLFMQGRNALAFSTDSALTWTPLAAAGLSSPVRHCFFHPSGAVVALTDAGIFRADYPAADFVQAAGFSSHDVQAVLPESDGSWWIGSELGLFHSSDKGESWQSVLDSLGSPAITWIRRVGPHVLATNGNANANTLFDSPDGGKTWLKRTLPTSTYFNDLEVVGNKIFVTSCYQIWQSQNWGATWEKFTPEENGTAICGRTFHQRDSFLALGARYLGVFLSRDTGATWQNFSAGLGGGNLEFYELGMSPQHLYAVSGYRLMRSPFTAPQWSKINLPFYPSDETLLPRQFLFTGTTIQAGIAKRGVYRSQNDGVSWSLWAQTPLYGRANSFYFTDTLMLMAVNGGVWHIGNLPGVPTFGGRAYIDVNQNQTFDNGDTPLPNHLVKLKNQQIMVATGADGRYAFDWRDQADSLSLVFFNTGAVSTPAVHAATGPSTNLDFAVAPIALGADLAVDLSASGVPRPGFSFDMYLTCRNDGYTAAGGQVSMIKDARLTWQKFNKTPAKIMGDTARWVFPAIPPGGSVTFRATLKVDASIPLGSWLNFAAHVLADSVLDLDGLNNEVKTQVRVFSSFDPNDKSVVPEGPITPAMVADSQQLVYTVRFQNTGDYPADFVRITDTLSSGVDLASLRVLAASHPFEWSLRGRVIEFFFPNIQLPDSTSDEPGSHGFVKYNLRVRPDLKQGEAVENFADIFFDFNKPVRTNTVRTLVDEPSGTTAPAAASLLVCHLAPNPVQDLLTVSWELPSGELASADLEIFDSNGRTLRHIGQAISPARLPVRDLSPGNYWLKIRSGGHEGSVQWIKAP